MSSTTAGARFGFALVGLILLTNLTASVPARRHPRHSGHRTVAAGGFPETQSPLSAAVPGGEPGHRDLHHRGGEFCGGLLLTNIPLLAGLDFYGLSIAALAVSGLVLLLGHYRALDRLSGLLVVLCHPAHGDRGCIAADPRPRRGCGGELGEYRSQPLTLANLAFLIPLMGWMPDRWRCVTPLWMFSRARDTEHTATPKEAEFDFNLGYGVTVVTAMFFVILGATRCTAAVTECWPKWRLRPETDQLTRRHGWLGGLGDHPGGFFRHVQHHPHLPGCLPPQHCGDPGAAASSRQWGFSSGPM